MRNVLGQSHNSKLSFNVHEEEEQD